MHLSGKIGIKIPSHNSITPTFLDELLETVTTSRKTADAHSIRRRLSEKYHIAIVSTGLSYLVYLGALEKTHSGYKPTRLGKKIGKLISDEHLPEANFAWAELLKRHRLYGILTEYISNKENHSGQLDDLGLYLRKRTHARWNISSARSRISRVCELFAEKGLFEYQNSILSDLNYQQPKPEAPTSTTSLDQPASADPNLASKEDFVRDGTAGLSIRSVPPSISISTDSWPLKIEIKIDVSDKATPEIVEKILSFLKEMKKPNM